MKRRSISIIGSTGSIGTQSIEVIEANTDLFEIDLLATYSNADLLIKQAIKTIPNAVIIFDENKYEYVKEKLKSLPIKVFAGEKSVVDYIDNSLCDTVIFAISGFSSIEPIIKAIEKKKRIALANKELLVVAGEIIKNLVDKYRVDFIPIDSEHSALFQCLMGENPDFVEKIVLTASGGPFRTYTREQLENVTPDEALCHPTWKMGNKITIDSATLMNKGLEIIEAYWLFGFQPEQIEVVIHPQSIIHSFVQFIDGSIKAQLNLPDMRIPIQFALSFPYRIANPFPKTNIQNLSNLTFYEPNFELFPCLSLAYEALKKLGNIPCIMNAANEVAVKAFLERNIKFYDIPKIIETSMMKLPYIKAPTLQELIETDKETRIFASSIIENDLL
jgi:1-deoxy-D-xylulose-5-phosphate reductoisomerase